ncbi:hypothetical protein V8D89_006096, partial [Ganoderma adspersum]
IPVTFDVATRKARPIFRDEDPHKTVGDFLRASCSEQWIDSGEMLQTSIAKSSLPTLKPQRNGFVHTVVEAYGQHHNLRIRPDDVWIAILSQLSFYVNKHAEELRKYFVFQHFVVHRGKKELRVEAVGSRYTVNFGCMAVQMSRQIHENIRTLVIDKTLVEWVLPDFTTSTPQDTTICSVLLMLTLQKYFAYSFHITCGLPSVTLEGEKADWERLYDRFNRLLELGTEPEQWAAMLHPILHQFVDAFDGNLDVTFWEHVVNRNRMCGHDGLSGWITAFCVWDVHGKWLANDINVTAPSTGGMGSVMTPNSTHLWSDPKYTLDGVPYFSLDMKDILAGYSEVDVLVIDNGEEFLCKMVSGHIASAMSGGRGWSIQYFESCPTMVLVREVSRETCDMEDSRNLDRCIGSTNDLRILSGLCSDYDTGNMLYVVQVIQSLGYAVYCRLPRLQPKASWLHWSLYFSHLLIHKLERGCRRMFQMSRDHV